MLKEFFINAASLAIFFAISYLSNLAGDFVSVSFSKQAYENQSMEAFMFLLHFLLVFTAIRYLLVSFIPSENK